MYLEILRRAKADQNLTSKQMAERSKLHTTEETIHRFLTGKTSDIHISTLMDLADILGLAPHELFMEKAISDEFRLFLESKVSNLSHTAELEALRIQTTEQAHKIEHLEIELAHKTEIIDLYKKIIDMK